MRENTSIARRFIRNYLHVNAIQPCTIQIRNGLLKSVKCAKQTYEIHLEEQKKFTKENKKNKELVEANSELQTITVQCSLLEGTIKKLDA